MPCCAAINCSNRGEKGFRLFLFPRDAARRSQWIQNMRRDNWAPTSHSRLCEVHFEDSQFENHRADGWKKLKQNAIPTLFDLPNPPPMIDPRPRKSLYKYPATANESYQSCELNLSPLQEESEPITAPAEVVEQLKQENQELKCTILQLREHIKYLEQYPNVLKKLQEENEELRKQVADIKTSLKEFLNDAQIKKLEKGRINEWPNDAIIKGIKLRFALSVRGYNYLRTMTGYPSPGYSTIMRRIQGFKIEFGIFKSVFDLLKFKVETMEPADKFCMLSYDEMQISQCSDYDVTTGKHLGYVTLDPVTQSETWNPSEDDLGEKILLVLVRGVKNCWKQVIACHITRRKKNQSLDVHCQRMVNKELRAVFKDFLLDCIKAVEDCGLYVTNLGADLDSMNKGIWTSMNIKANSSGVRSNTIIFNDHEICVSPDPCHLLKNLKSAMLRQPIFLPEEYTEQENLPTKLIEGSFIKKLWDYEMSNSAEKRLLHHLRKEDIYPSNFDKMNVGAACRFFSSKTASALKTAVALDILPQEALTTSHFVVIINEWFSLINSKLRKTSITTRNCDRKYIFLHTIIELFQNTVFKSGWKPLNYGFVLCTLSFCDTAEFLMKNGFDFVLGHRFTQDATENIFSQIRRKAGSLPTALEAQRAIRMICISHFVSDVKQSSYMSDSDEFLLDFCKEKTENVPFQSVPQLENMNSIVRIDVPGEFNIATHSIKEFEAIMDARDANCIFYIAGSTTRAVEKYVCHGCKEFISTSNLPDSDFIRKAKIYTASANRGGLIEPCMETLSLIFHCEKYFVYYQKHILKNGNSELMKCLVKSVNVNFPSCCSLKEKMVKHFFKVRSFCVKNFSQNNKSFRKVYGTSSEKKQTN